MRDADHGGPTMRPRLRAMCAWLGSLWQPAALDAAAEEAASVWLQSGMQGKAPAGATTTHAFIRFLRAGFEPLRSQAAESDPNTKRATSASSERMPFSLPVCSSVSSLSIASLGKQPSSIMSIRGLAAHTRGDYKPLGANQPDLLADCCQLVGFSV